LLFHGRPTIDFENMRFLKKLFKVKHCPIKQWCDNVGWGMVKAFHSIVKKAMKLD
jgi:hypothetical protein